MGRPGRNSVILQTDYIINVIYTRCKSWGSSEGQRWSHKDTSLWNKHHREHQLASTTFQRKFNILTLMTGQMGMQFVCITREVDRNGYKNRR
jgi:hypothetical protein